MRDKTPNAILLERCIRLWQSGQRPHSTIRQQVEIDRELARHENVWTPEERAIIKKYTANFKIARS